MGRTEEGTVQKVVLDAGPLIHLEELDCLALLSDFRELIVPAAVWLEVESHRPALFRASLEIYAVYQAKPSEVNYR